jgi:predicted RNA methylase
LSFSSVPTEVKVWVNFNGTGTPSIRASFNVTSITDLGTGNYRVNFTNALTDANYAYAFAVNYSNSLVTTAYQDTLTAPTSSSLTFYVANTSNDSATDATQICVSIFR